MRRHLLTLAGLLWPAMAFAQQPYVVQYYHTDALGSVRAVTNQQGVVISRHDFMPFGEECKPLSPPGTGCDPAPPPSSDKRLFTGKERDQETHFDYFEARSFSAEVGRFATPDPKGTSGPSADPQSWNRYAYCRNNPLRRHDPSGMTDGEYYDKNGAWLGTDGIDDGMLWLILSDAFAQAAKNGKIKVVEVPGNAKISVNKLTREAVASAVTMSDSPDGDDPLGGDHEVAVATGYANFGAPKVNFVVGPFAGPGSVTATVDLGLAVNGIIDLRVMAHVHPSGSKSHTNWTQGPSDDRKNLGSDVNNVYPSVNLVVGAGDRTVRFFDTHGTYATMPLDTFSGSQGDEHESSGVGVRAALGRFGLQLRNRGADRPRSRALPGWRT